MRKRAYGMSGGPYEDLREGWAVLYVGATWGQVLPHYWKRFELTDRYTSLCGLTGEVSRTIPTSMHPSGQKMIFHPGDFLAARCSKCALKRSKQVTGRR